MRSDFKGMNFRENKKPVMAGKTQ